MWVIEYNIDTKKYMVGYYNPNGQFVSFKELWYDKLSTAVTYAHYLNGGEK